MKKLVLILFMLSLSVFLTGILSGQSTRVYNQDVRINKTTPVLDLQGLGAMIYLDGATSGTATLKPPAVAGATVHTLPSTTGTLVNATDVSSTYATIASPAFTGSVPTSGGIPLGRTTSITGTFTAGALTDVTLTGVTTKPYHIMIQTTAGKDITSAVSDSLAFTGGVYHLHVYSVDLITDAEIKVTY
jgi:hypothetical protein